LSQFGDFEPEDAWSPYDDISELVRNLVARMVLLGITLRVRGSNRRKLDEIDNKIRRWFRHRAEDATDRELVRASDIQRHIIVIRERLLNG
jgi:hypothetical protein